MPSDEWVAHALGGLIEKNEKESKR